MFTQMRGNWGRASRTLGHLLIRGRPDDRYICAHPRSGSTWLRTILVNILRPDAMSNPDVFNAVIPGVSLRKVYRVNKLPSPRIIMSHSCFRRGIPAAVYLVRDGRDVIVSFYHYMVTRRGRTERFPEFFDRYCQGVYGHLWHQNVESWLGEGKSSMGERLMVVRFEDLKADTETVFGEIAHFLQVPASPDQLREAIQAASLERQREIERSRWQSLWGRTPNQNESFYRGGRSGQWKDYFTPSIEQRFYEISSRALTLAGYDF